MNLVAVAFNQGSTLIVNIIVARILLKQSFGEYAMVQSTILTVSTLSQLATGYTASKYIAEYRTRDPVRAGRIMGLCTVVSVLMAGVGTLLHIVMAPLLASTMLKAPHLAFPLILGSGFLFFSTINGYQTGALAGLESFGGLAKAGIASGTMAVISISLGAWWGGLNGTLAGFSISAFIRCAIHNKWLRIESQAQGIKSKFKGSIGQEKAVILNFALPAAIAGYYSMPMIWLANTFLVRQPDGYGEMAVYSAANNLRVLVLLLPNVMNSVGLSVLNNENTNGDKTRYYSVFRTNVKYIFFVSLVGVLFMGILGRSILQFFGKDFVSGYFLLWILLVASLFEGVCIALYQYVQSKARIWLSFFSISVPREAFLVVSSYYLVKHYGGAGLALSYMGSAFLGLIFHFSLVTLLYRKERNGLKF